MRKFLSIALCLTLPVCLFAEETAWLCLGFLSSQKTSKTSYVYTTTETDGVQTVTRNNPLVKNELFRVAIVRDARSNVTATTTPSVAVNKAGQLVSSGVTFYVNADGKTVDNDPFLGAVWAELSDVTNASYTSVKVGETAGIPETSLDSTWNGFNVFTPSEGIPGSGGSIYIYLVAFDTRSEDGSCSENSRSLSSYAMALCLSGGTSAKPTYAFGERTQPITNYVLGGETKVVDTYYYLETPGQSLGWEDAVERITTVTANGDTYSVSSYGEEDLATVSGVSYSGNDASADGNLTLSLTSHAVNQELYWTLYTSTTLTATDWQPFADYLESAEKTLDDETKKSYTDFEIGVEGKTLKIPVIESDTSRFYKLQGAWNFTF